MWVFIFTDFVFLVIFFDQISLDSHKSTGKKKKTCKRYYYHASLDQKWAKYGITILKFS